MGTGFRVSSLSLSLSLSLSGVRGGVDVKRRCQCQWSVPVVSVSGKPAEG
jgi:hypothetical protein